MYAHTDIVGDATRATKKLDHWPMTLAIDSVKRSPSLNFTGKGVKEACRERLKGRTTRIRQHDSSDWTNLVAQSPGQG